MFLPLPSLTANAPANGWFRRWISFWVSAYFQGRLLLVSGRVSQPHSPIYIVYPLFVQAFADFVCRNYGWPIIIAKVTSVCSMLVTGCETKRSYTPPKKKLRNPFKRDHPKRKFLFLGAFLGLRKFCCFASSFLGSQGFCRPFYGCDSNPRKHRAAT